MNTIFKLNFLDCILPEKNDRLKQSTSISLNVYFSYKKKIKECFYFLQIGDGLAIIGKIDQQFIVNSS